MIYACSTIGEDDLSAVQTLEREIGRPLLALSQIQAAPAEVGDDDLRKIRELEQRLGLVLVAVEG